MNKNKPDFDNSQSGLEFPQLIGGGELIKIRCLMSGQQGDDTFKNH